MGKTSIFVGTKFNFLTLIQRIKSTDRQAKGIFRCDCGSEKEYRITAVSTGSTKSCGCHRKQRLIKHQLIKHPLYARWSQINPKCEEWKEFPKFLEWGETQPYQGETYIQRKDNTKEYSPENCFFILKKDYKIKINPEKTKATILQKYGVEYPGQIEKGKEKRKKTNLIKYGYENALSSPEVKKKIIETNLKKYGGHHMKTEATKEKIRQSFRKSGIMKYYDDKHVGELSKELGISRSCMLNRIKKYGIEKALLMDKRQSEIETLFEIAIKEKKWNYKKQIKCENRFIDFLIEDKIAIELDGLYWHSDAVNKNKKYHVEKKELYKKNNFIPLFFREDEIINKLSIIVSIISNKLGLSIKTGARKTYIKELTKEESKQFFETNHLMGHGSGISYGLIKDNEILSACQIINRKGGIEISRFSHKQNNNVVGGFSKLISHILKEKRPNFISTFIDLRYGNGEYLLNLGFTKISEHLSFRWVKNDKTYHRMQFKGNSGYEEKCFKIWDCGQALYKYST